LTQKCGIFLRWYICEFFFKGLSSETDLAESGIIERSSLNGEARRFRESVRPSSCESLLKTSRSTLGNWDPNCQRGRKIHRAVGIGKTWCIALVAHLLISRSVRCAIASRQNKHSDCNKFSMQLVTGSKFVHSAIANKFI